MRWAHLAVIVCGLAGCNQVFGLDPAPKPEAVDSPALDSSSLDSSSLDASPGDASSGDASPWIDAPGPIDAPCVPIDDGLECTDDVCQNGVLQHPPRPRDTFCNGFADQCDGYGHCVDCTNNGGCGECCACSNQVCIPV